MSRYAAVVLAAGLGSRFHASGGQGPSKLVALLEGIPVVRHVVKTASASRADCIVVVTGHAAQAVGSALQGLAFIEVTNADYAEGLASSLKAGIAALPADVAGAVILLGDMPLIRPGLIDRLLEAARLDPMADAIVPVSAGRRGNPVILARSLFAAVGRLAGDAGARELLRSPGIRVKTIEADDAGITLDIDEASDLAQLGAHQGPG